jgi:hypothetical protein
MSAHRIHRSYEGDQKLIRPRPARPGKKHKRARNWLVVLLRHPLVAALILGMVVATVGLMVANHHVK